MKRISPFFHIGLLLLCTSLCAAQPGTVNMTPVTTYPGGLQSVLIGVPEKFRSLIDTNRVVELPQYYEPKIFYIGGLTKPRVLEFSPKGILHVIDFKTGGAVYALPDLDDDGVADTLLPVVTGVNGHDFKFYQNDIYVAERTRILRCRDTNGDGVYETKTTFIDSIGLRSNNPNGGHVTRTILFDTLARCIYVSIGSSCNVCRDIGRAIIERYDLDGGNRKIFATGIRNAIGLAQIPGSTQLWANNNGSDQQGNNIPPEWIDIIREDGFYGFPFAYGNQVWFNMDAHANYSAMKPITAADSAWVIQMQEPAGLIQAHSAPMELEYIDLSWDMVVRQGFLSALHGSWNRSPATGYKLVYLDKSTGSKLGSVSDFLRGFLTDSITGAYWARPVGIAVHKKPYPYLKDIYLSSDAGKTCVILLKDRRPVGTEEVRKVNFEMYPNPFDKEIYLGQPISENAIIHLSDLHGREVGFKIGLDRKSIIPDGIPDGIYFLRIEQNNTFFTGKVIHAHFN